MSSGSCIDDIEPDEEESNQNDSTKGNRSNAILSIRVLLSTPGLVILVVCYSILGAFIFQILEAPTEHKKINAISKSREDCLKELWIITERLNVLYEKNWTRLVHEQLRRFENSIMAATNGAIGGGSFIETNTGGSDRLMRWSFTEALIYSLTVITTIGHGNLSPHTAEGKIVTMFYALIGVPLMLMCLSSLGGLLADALQCLYTKMCGRRRKQLGRTKHRNKQKECIEDDSTMQCQDCTQSCQEQIDCSYCKYNSIDQNNKLQIYDKFSIASSQDESCQLLRQSSSPTKSILVNSPKHHLATTSLINTSCTTNRCVTNQSSIYQQNSLSGQHQYVCVPVEQNLIQQPTTVQSHLSLSPKHCQSDLGITPTTTSSSCVMTAGIAQQQQQQQHHQLPTKSILTNSNQIISTSPYRGCITNEKFSTLPINNTHHYSSQTNQPNSIHLTNNEVSMKIDQIIGNTKREHTHSHNSTATVHGYHRSKFVPKPLPQEINMLMAECDLKSCQQYTTIQGDGRYCNYSNRNDEDDDDEETRTSCQHGTPSKMPLIQTDRIEKDNKKKIHSTRSTDQTMMNPNDDVQQINRTDDIETIKQIADIQQVPITLILFILISYISIGTIIFSIWENWSIIDGAYFCFVTLSTIGFGDLLPSHTLHGPEIQLIACCIYLLLGLVLVAMAFILLETKLAWRCRRIAVRLKLTDD